MRQRNSFFERRSLVDRDSRTGARLQPGEYRNEVALRRAASYDAGDFRRCHGPILDLSMTGPHPNLPVKWVRSAHGWRERGHVQREADDATYSGTAWPEPEPARSARA